MAFTALIFTKLTITQRHYTDICAGFRLYLSRSEQVWIEIHLLPKLKYDYHRADFHENHAYAINFHKESLYRIL
jgi:hypothetical protein